MLNLGKESADVKSVKKCSNYIYITRGKLSSKYKSHTIMFIYLWKKKKEIHIQIIDISVPLNWFVKVVECYGK